MPRQSKKEKIFLLEQDLISLNKAVDKHEKTFDRLCSSSLSILQALIIKGEPGDNKALVKKAMSIASVYNIKIKSHQEVSDDRCSELNSQIKEKEKELGSAM